MRRWLRTAARLYPKRWRERYSAEFDALLNELQPVGKDVLDVLSGAVLMHAKMISRQVYLAGGMALAGMLVAGAVAYSRPPQYESTSVIHIASTEVDNPRTKEWLTDGWREVVSQASLAEVIQRPKLDLFRRDRRRKPLEDVIEEMKDKSVFVDIRRERDRSETFRISFVYPDPWKAQAVANALTVKMGEARRSIGGPGIQMTPAEVPLALRPNVLLFLAWGLAIGLATGGVTNYFYGARIRR